MKLPNKVLGKEVFKTAQPPHFVIGFKVQGFVLVLDAEMRQPWASEPGYRVYGLLSESCEASIVKDRGFSVS